VQGASLQQTTVNAVEDDIMNVACLHYCTDDRRISIVFFLLEFVCAVEQKWTVCYSYFIIVTTAFLASFVSNSDVALEERCNINTAQLLLVARVQCSTLVAQCSRQRIGPADWVFVTLGPLRCA